MIKKFGQTWGGWAPIRDHDLQTSLNNLYVVGDMAGIRGAEAAQLEGHLASTAIARKYGLNSAAEYHRRSSHLRHQLKKQEKFGLFLEEIFNPGGKLLSRATFDTILCRCEAITYQEVSQAIENGAQSMRAIKALTRAGMGNCQGRTCEARIHNLLHEEPKSKNHEDHWTVRPPIFPLPVNFLAKAD